MTFFPADLGLKGKMDKFVFIEAIMNTGFGVTGQVRGLVGDGILIAASLKIFGWEQYWWILPIGIFLYLTTIFWIGTFLYRKNIIMRRGNLNNKISNPQLIKVERLLEEQAKRKE